MSKKCISLAMSLILLVGTLCCSAALPAAAEVTTTAATTVPQGNLLVGLTPFSGTNPSVTRLQEYVNMTQISTTALADNQFATASVVNGSTVHSGRLLIYTDRKISWDTGAVCEFTSFLVGSEAAKAQWLNSVNIYVSDDLSTLYDEINLVVSSGCNDYQNTVITPGVAVTGRYVGFDFTADSVNGTNGNGWLRMGELGAYGKKLYSIAQATDVPQGNLLVGLTPYQLETSDRYRLQEYVNMTQISTAALADDTFATSSVVNGSTTHSGRLLIFNNRNVCWDLGAVCSLTGFLVGSSAEAARRIQSVTLYVSDSESDLYNESNRVQAAVDCSQWQNTVITLGEAVTGRYVGFDFISDADNYGTLGYYHLGELGAYGKKAYTLSEATTAPEGNLLVGLTPFQVETSDRYRLQEYVNMTQIATTALADNEFATKTIENNTTTHHGRLIIFNNRNICWDLGGLYDLTGFLVSSEINASDWLNSVTLYVSDTEEDIYDASNLVQADVDISQWQTTVISLVESVTGRYIAFDFISDSENFVGNYYRLGELGAYGTAKQAKKQSLGAAVRSQNEDGTYDLRFGFNAEFSGVDYAAEDSYVRCALDENSTIMVDGVMRQVTDFGTMVSADVSTADDLVVDNAAAKKVSAINLYDVQDDVVTFTAVVTNVPVDYADEALYARPYVEYVTADGNIAYLYGEMLARSVEGVKDAVGLV